MLHTTLHYLASLFLAFLSSIPALILISKRSLGLTDRKTSKHEGLYEDEDGIALHRTQRTRLGTTSHDALILACSLFGLLLSLVAVVDAAFCDANRLARASWLTCAVWV